ncbi:bacteriocin-associated integral membrane protein [Streptococcus pneumoniae]|uniref:Bacteriocin-associated integral membrane protein n=1 Tax=Streptococcus pneumoniae TaxID=1313 RepID=A0A4J2EF38_STREE|nr:bacteriocin-associated integral membrane protein [Streptococcus pneumoniae]VMV36299.1 bacteriocin-associated integral membrane protein [Streptococcus pneumoniae]VNQ66256.1 bacteriocin-associated integral membrane protein [Streptococcus pneumoniae]VPC00485.1 bacteriocin-associated integral membrane protein [Streptococcus pneumoniae]VPU31236.1 bacteriocin-associated integral membrane protein [Streptococcus pneumoniae]
MKKLFILISNLLASLFFVWVFTIWTDTYVSHYYPNVVVHDSSPETTFQHVATRLEKLAEETDSFIAIQHQDPNSEGTTVFSYTTFGDGKLPDGLQEKKLEDAQSSSVETNYFVFDGHLDIHLLREELSQLGLTNMHLTIPSKLSTLMAIFSNGFQLISLLIFILTFGALTLISQISQLRSSGIRLISGEKRWSIFLRPVGDDLKGIAVGFSLAGVLTILMQKILSLPTQSLMTIGAGLLSYNLILLSISLFFAQLFAVGIKKIHLMQIIKGQVPVRGIISLILIGQLLAIIIVTLGIGSSLKYSQAWQQHRIGQEAWSQERQLITLSISREGTSPGFDEQAQRKLRTWYQLMDLAVSEQKAFLSRHQLIDRTLQNGMASSKNFITSTEWHDYSPNGNVLIVTPQYLERQNIPVDTTIEQKMNHLDVGEFVLLLPEHLRSEEEHYKSVFEDDLTSRMSSQDERQQMTATVGYLESGQDRFVYNTTPISYQQFLKDPIIIVITPQSTGPQSILFWIDAVQNYVLFNQLSDAQELIQRQGIENWVSEMQTGYHNYITLLDNIQRERWVMLAGAVLGIATSILLFNTMNRLYFEEFRRAIFIKRIAGLRFLEIHRTYLFAQLGVFLLGFVASVFLQVEIGIAFLVLLLFTGLSLLQLHVQMQKENKMSILVLKGG